MTSFPPVIGEPTTTTISPKTISSPTLKSYKRRSMRPPRISPLLSSPRSEATSSFSSRSRNHVCLPHPIQRYTNLPIALQPRILHKRLEEDAQWHRSPLAIDRSGLDLSDERERSRREASRLEEVRRRPTVVSVPSLGRYTVNSDQMR